MKFKPIVFTVIILCIFFLTTGANAQDSFKRFNLRFSGGPGNTRGGDMEDVIDGLNSQLASIASMAGFTLTGKVENVNWGPDFEGEFVVNVTKNIGVGLGVGYSRRVQDSTARLEFEGMIAGSFSWEPKYRVIPILLSGYYHFPVASKWDAFLRVGVGYYYAKIDYLIREEAFFGGAGFERSDGKATDSSIGLHGSLGIEFNVSENVALYAEGLGRYVSFNDWDVEDVYTDSTGYTEIETGTFWYVDELNPLTGTYYASLELSEDKPTRSSLKNVRKAEFTFSGFSFRVGVRIRFGK